MKIRFGDRLVVLWVGNRPALALGGGRGGGGGGEGNCLEMFGSILPDMVGVGNLLLTL